MTTRTITFDDEQWQVVPKILAPVMWHAMLASPTESMAWSAALASAPEPQVCFCDEKGIGDPAKSCGDCPRDYGMPTVRANPEPPAQQQDEQLPPYSAWMHVIDEAMVVRHLGVADSDDDYITAKRKLHAMFDWEIDVATDPAIGGDRVRKQQPMTDEEMLDVLRDADCVILGEDYYHSSRAIIPCRGS